MTSPVRAPLVFSQLHKLGLAQPIPAGYVVGVQELQRLRQVLADHGVPPDIAIPSPDTLINSRYRRKVRGIVASYLFVGDGPLASEQPCIDAGLGLSTEQHLRLPSRISDAVHLDAMLQGVHARLSELRRLLGERIERSRSESGVFLDQTALGLFRMPSDMRQHVANAARQLRRNSLRTARKTKQQQATNRPRRQSQPGAQQ
jgi:hypothetical protein